MRQACVDAGMLAKADAEAAFVRVNATRELHLHQRERRGATMYPIRTPTTPAAKSNGHW